MIRTFLVIGILSLAKIAFSCSCLPDLYFCTSIGPNTKISLVKVLSNDSMFMQVVVLDSIWNQLSSDTITIAGGDGADCSESVDQFEIGDSLILGLYGTNTIDTYYISTCGLFFLHVNNGVVNGNISPGITEQSYSSFISTFHQCQTVSVEENETSIPRLNIDGTSVVLSEPMDNLREAQLYDFQGRLLNHFSPQKNSPKIGDMSGFKSGVYLIVLLGKNQQYTTRFFYQSKE